MTQYGPLRAQLAEQYVREHRGMVVDPFRTFAPQSPPLMHSYLQFLTRRRLPMMKDPGSEAVPNAIDWEGEKVGPQLMRWAEYTPGPYVPVGEEHKHRGIVWPWKGDVVVFAGGPGNPYGTLGVYLSHEGEGLDAVWEVFTQGPGPAQTIHLPVSAMVPVGWWRVTDERLAARDKTATTNLQQVAP